MSRPNLDAEVQRCDGTDAVTQALLGELIQKPKLTEKLLAKPPFRFLHDIIMEVMRATGFATGLFTEAECDSAAITEKAQKTQFLDKIITLVGVQLNTLVGAKSGKIVAGLDAESTNNFLQLLAVAAKNFGTDCRPAVMGALEQLGLEGGLSSHQTNAKGPVDAIPQAATMPTKHEEKHAEEPPSRPSARQPQVVTAVLQRCVYHYVVGIRVFVYQGLCCEFMGKLNPPFRIENMLNFCCQL